MRLIDADALKKRICERYPHITERLALYEVFDAIRNTPSIDAVPLREGKWLMKWLDEDEYGNQGFNFICSECGVPSYEFSQPYCHRCGAKMKELKWVNEE